MGAEGLGAWGPGGLGAQSDIPLSTGNLLGEVFCLLYFSRTSLSSWPHKHFIFLHSYFHISVILECICG